MKKISLGFVIVVLAVINPKVFSQSISFNTPGNSTWTVPSGVNFISIYCWGGGGGGGGATYGITSTSSWSFSGVGKGGGSGGFNKIINYPVSPGQVLTVGVGAGGQYNTVVYNTSGNGGSSGVLTASGAGIVVASGGTGASGSAYQTTPTNGIGGSPNGANGTLQNGGGTIACNSTVPYQCPGGGTGGVGATIPTSIGAVNGGNGTAPGGGGGGGAVKDDFNGTMLSAHGGNGGNGRVIIFVSKIDLTATSLDWSCLAVNSTCPTKIFQLTGYLLNSQIVVKPPTGYMVSTTSNFASFGTNSTPLNITVSGPSQTQQINTAIYVKLESTLTQAQYAGNIEISCPGMSAVTSKYVTLNAVVGIIPNSTINYGGPTTVCSGNQVALSVDSVAGLVYQWKNNNVNINGANNSIFNVVNSGNYSVSVTNSNGCSSASNGIQITVNPLPSAIISSSSPLGYCMGDIILNDLTVSQAQNYLWNTGDTTQLISVSQQGIYSVLATDVNGCQNSDSIQITVNPLPNVTAGNDQITCNGQSITLNASGATTYSWNNSVTNNSAFTPTASNTYVVEGTDANGCQDSDSVNITVTQNTSSTINQTANNTYTFNGQTYTQSGTYTQVIPNANGCDSTITLNLTINNIGLDEVSNSAISIYPNPASNQITIAYAGQIQKVEITDTKGARVYSSIDNKKEIVLPSNMQSGYYLVLVQAAEGIFRKELVVNR